MADIFESNRTYLLGDPELEVLGSREKLAQWRHRNVGPAFIRIGRRIAYHGADLNAWLNARRIDPSNEAA
ncbi:hypothetical protein ROA7450_00540 [Roseovarius albus]|uniref:MerR family transcriptional regulator n=1 Tax=Roseovarius albus TaxID=1247867 RepID=A0A1X6YCV8_9RHOB|nr:MerR family transcriptional regulator [Roseovarius albus]SLN17252.1 hypothetical protein ROA7450_00540 [Roseovarius albus]